jgi:hypothetical protein
MPDYSENRVYSASDVARQGLVGYKDRHMVVKLIKSGKLQAKIVKTPKSCKYFVSTDSIKEYMKEV